MKNFKNLTIDQKINAMNTLPKHKLVANWRMLLDVYVGMYERGNVDNEYFDYHYSGLANLCPISMHDTRHAILFHEIDHENRMLLCELLFYQLLSKHTLNYIDYHIELDAIIHDTCVEFYEIFTNVYVINNVFQNMYYYYEWIYQNIDTFLINVYNETTVKHWKQR